jgi:hypothetical protein
VIVGGGYFASADDVLPLTDVPFVRQSLNKIAKWLQASDQGYKVVRLQGNWLKSLKV